MRNLALYLAPDGVRVNAVALGTIRTRVWQGQEGGAERMKPLYPLGRVGEPEDVAGAVVFLASTDAAWITGHTLPVDGGLLLLTRRSRSWRTLPVRDSSLDIARGQIRVEL
jgi:meso-butanediol dehydrogenase / (S,S)-butanediol dehydrogenase / diacetyl reductase